ncbi:MAG TPA: DEAD/DEAH box helicase [Burkholderiales bacterium]
MSFSNLGLSEPLLRAVSEQGYTQPTPIQAQAIPAVLAGGDLLAGAQTGTGKTAGFTLPILQRLSAANAPVNPFGGRPVRALILTPTRELAAQVEESVRTYGKYLKLNSTVIFGGVGINPQISILKKGVDILVATPGRLLDLHQQRAVNLSKVEILVLDEADRMLDMGFIHDIKRVLKVLPAQRQNLLFSATFADEIKALADSLLNKPAMIEVARRNSTVEVIEQKIHPVDRDKKAALLIHLIKEHNWFQVLVFTRTKHGANRLADHLNHAGITAMAIHGNKSQGARTRALSEFKTSDLQVLVATDIAARGIDIDQLPHVVNYDLPNVPEDYVHRIGRTGRAGATGEAVSLVCVDEHAFLRDIERLIKREIPRVVVAGFEPDPNAKAEPIPMGRGQGRPSGQGRPAGGRGQGQGRSSQGAGAGQRAPQRDGQRDGQNAARGNGNGQRQGAARSGASAQPQPARATATGAKGGNNGGNNGGARAPQPARSGAPAPRGGPRSGAGAPSTGALLHRSAGRGR